MKRITRIARTTGRFGKKAGLVAGLLLAVLALPDVARRLARRRAAAADPTPPVFDPDSGDGSSADSSTTV